MGEYMAAWVSVADYGRMVLYIKETENTISIESEKGLAFAGNYVFAYADEKPIKQIKPSPAVKIDENCICNLEEYLMRTIQYTF